MGKGKGKLKCWVCPIKKGAIVYEVSALSSFVATKALLKCSYKLPMKCRLVKLVY